MFNELERRVFGPYYNGRETVYADPIRVYRRLQVALKGEVNKWIEAARAEDAGVRAEAEERLVAAAVEAFGLFPLNPQSGEGMREDEILDVLSAYSDYLNKKKVNGQTSQTSMPPTGSAVSPSPMTMPSASGSISKESDCNGCGKRPRHLTSPPVGRNVP